MKNINWKQVLQFVITVLTAIAGAVGLQSCLWAMKTLRIIGLTALTLLLAWRSLPSVNWRTARLLPDLCEQRLQLPFDQLIIYPTFLHVSWSTAPRRQVIRRRWKKSWKKIFISKNCFYLCPRIPAGVLMCAVEAVRWTWNGM